RERPGGPVEDAQGTQRVPTAGAAVACLEREMDLAGVGVIQQPAAVRLLPRADHADGGLQPWVRRAAGGPKVLEAAQHVVVPARGKGKAQPGRVDNLAVALPSEQLTFEQVGLAAASGCQRGWRATGGLLVGQEALQDIDGGVERR